MINRKVKTHIEGIDKEIESLMIQLAETQAIGEQYKNILDRVETLVKIREELVTPKKADKNSNLYIGALITGAFSIAQLLMIMNYEKTDIITTKGMTVVTKWLGK